MDRHQFLTLTSTTQWVLFVALSLIIYSIIEKKPWVRLSGLSLFTLLSVFAVWVMNSGIITVPATGPGEPAPHEARLLSLFLGLALCGIASVIALLLSFVKPKYASIPNYLLIPAGIALFFMIYHLQRF